MKRLFAIVLVVLMVFSLGACKSDEPLVDVFKDNSDKSAQEIADLMAADESLPFMTMTMAIEEGLLNGFGNVEITGFDEGVMFGPAVSTIPFIGYVFTLSEDTDVDVFVETLQNNADLKWNICTEAEELIIETDGNKVVVIMKPESFEQEDVEGGNAEDEMVIEGEDFVDFE